MSNNNVLLHLFLIDGVGPATIKKILDNRSAHFNVADLYSFSAHDIVQHFFITHKVAQKIVAGLADTTLLEKELALIGKHNINWATVLDTDYPELLKNITIPPTVVYWQGALLKNEKQNLAIVGARKCNEYANVVLNTLVPELVIHDWCIVSGGALGVDAMAHEQTVNAGGKTIVVLGSGLLKPYPASNKKLFGRVIANGGTIVSIFPLMAQAMPGNFPARNRVIAGLSKGTLVVQAAQKSGALITAHYALEQGREVFAVPGPINDALSAGCHRLLQQGAKLTASVNDILVEFGQTCEHEPIEHEVPKKSRSKRVAVEKVEQKPKNQVKATTPEGIVVHLCAQPRSVDELLEHVSMGLPELNTLLFNLQLEGHIEQNRIGMWITT